MNPELKLDPQLMELICCPACKDGSQLEPDESYEALVCDKCGKKFKLKKVAGPDGKGLLIPDLLIENQGS